MHWAPSFPELRPRDLLLWLPRLSKVRLRQSITVLFRGALLCMV
jgi:hypothetical protein